MKLYSFITLSAIVFITGCSNHEAAAGDDNTVSETKLPKGKYIIDDENTAVNHPIDNNGTFNGNNNAADTTTTIVKTKPELDVRRKYRNLLVFHADDTMKVKKAYIATLVLAKNQLYGDIKEEVLESSDAKNNKVKSDTTLEIGNIMKAKLMDMGGNDEKGFDIELIGDDGAERKITDLHKKVIWQWKLTPRKAGEQKLILSISVVENDGGRFNLPVRDIPVIIHAEDTDFWASIGNFFKEESTKWILSVLLVPIFLGWYNARMRHNFESKSRRSEKEKEAAAARQDTAGTAVQNVTDTQGSA